MTDLLPGLWFLCRASGVVLLVLLTLTLLLGIAASSRTTPSRWPRFATAALHADLAAISTVLLVVHVTTSVVDGFVAIDWLDVLVPFRSAYQPGWLGLGTLAALLFLAAIGLAATRRSLPARAWRLSHHVVYLAWPVAVAHGVGMGTDAGDPRVQAVTAGCVVAVTAALALRLRRAARQARPLEAVR